MGWEGGAVMNMLNQLLPLPLQKKLEGSETKSDISRYLQSATQIKRRKSVINTLPTTPIEKPQRRAKGRNKTSRDGDGQRGMRGELNVLNGSKCV